MAGYYEIQMDAGSTFDDEGQYFDEDGVVVDLTGYTAESEFRDTVDSPTPSLVASTANGKIIITGGVDSKFAYNLGPADTRLVKNNSVYDLKITSPGGKVETLIGGPAFVNPEITRP